MQNVGICRANNTFAERSPQGLRRHMAKPDSAVHENITTATAVTTKSGLRP